MIRDYILAVVTLALFFAILSNSELKQKLESKNEIIYNQQQSMMKLVGTKVNDENLKRLIEEAKK
jgi:hypothetical protein